MSEHTVTTDTLIEEIGRLTEWLDLMAETGAADDADPKAAWAAAANRGWTVDDLKNGLIPFAGDTVLEGKPRA